MAVGMGKWRSWMGWKRASTHSFLRVWGVVGDDGLFKEFGSRQLTGKESSQKKESKEEDTKEKANANAATVANANVNGRVASDICIFMSDLELTRRQRERQKRGGKSVCYVSANVW